MLTKWLNHTWTILYIEVIQCFSFKNDNNNMKRASSNKTLRRYTWCLSLTQKNHFIASLFILSLSLSLCLSHSSFLYFFLFSFSFRLSFFSFFAYPSTLLFLFLPFTVFFLHQFLSHLHLCPKTICIHLSKQFSHLSGSINIILLPIID